MNNELKNTTLKIAISILIVMVFIYLQMGLVGAWQSDTGNGTFNNPVLYADYPDPSMIRVGNDFYLASSTFVNSPGLVILHSQDLVNWEIMSHCISALPSGGAYDMNGGVKYGNGCFAPGLAYYNGTFYVAVNLNGDGGTRIYHATNPSGPWSYNQLSSAYFDPCLFFDNGTPYLVWGGAWENAIKMIQLNSSLSGTTGSQKTIISYSNIEGSHLVKRGNYYYLFNAVPAQKLVCSRSTSLWGPYGETTTLCTAGKGGHQGGIVDLPDGSYWGYLHQDDGAPGRMTRICPITWQNNWPMFGRSGYIGTVESSYTKPISGKPIMVPAASDEFNTNTLGLQWMWNHNPDNSKWSFTGSALRLKATTGSDFWHARNSLTQKGQGLTSSGSIRIDCSNMQNGDIGGLGILGDPRGYIAVTRDSSGKKIIMSEEDSVKATASSITATILYFRIEMDFNTKLAKFFWRDDSTTTWKQLGTTITMGFDWQNGTFQGEQYAILCFNTGSSSGYIDVDWFRLNDQPGPGGNQTPTPTPTQRQNTPTPTQPSPTPTPGNGAISIAAGSSSAVGDFQADQYYSGGSAYNNSNTVDVSQITSNPPPAALFNNERYGAFSYTIPGFIAGNSYTATLYFAETYLTASGKRLFNVAINGATVLSNFDIYAAAGGQNKAIARSFTATANSSGQIVISLTSGTENPKINGISIKLGGTNPTPTPTFRPTPTTTPTPTRGTNTPTPTPVGPTPTPGSGAISIAAGSSSAVGNFQADQYYSGGSTYKNSNTVDVTPITSNPPPAALFNNERYGVMSYTIPGFAAGSSYTVTLYFAETYLTSSGKRLFNVSINGATVLSNFDIYASAGGQNKAIARSFTVTANASGQIVIQFTSGTENPKINGISIKAQ